MNDEISNIETIEPEDFTLTFSEINCDEAYLISGAPEIINTPEPR